MNKGVLQIETDYSKNDFKLEWKELKYISSSKTHINLSSGDLLNGILSRGKTPNKCQITNVDTKAIIEVKLYQIVYIKPVDDSFWDRLDASFDAGIKLTKAQKPAPINSKCKFRLYCKNGMEQQHTNKFSLCRTTAIQSAD
jgi:hypothetical protein